MPPKRIDNPFFISGAVTGVAFADRDGERARIRAALTRPQHFALVYGPRRMGKTSALRVVQDELRSEGYAVALADLSTASSVADMTHRILRAAAADLGRTIADAAVALVRRLRFEVALEVDPTTGLPVPKLGASVRDADPDTQRTTLGDALDAVEQLAAERDTTVGLMLDEFQEIHRFGGEAAESHLRGVMQHHARVRYVLAGSDERLIRAMLGPRRAFYKMLAPIYFGPIEPGYFAGWIDERMGGTGVTSRVGAEIVALAGPRTRDVVQLAHEVVELARPGGKAMAEHVARGFTSIVEQEDAVLRVLWAQLPPLQQNVLRATAVNATGLTTAARRRAFALGSSGAATKAVQALVDRGVLVKSDEGYAYDSPFVRGWVIQNALPDAGVTLPVTHRPG